MARPLPEPVLFLVASGTEDEDWLPVVGARQWVVLTKDKWIRRREMEREALIQAKVAAFVLSAGNLTGTEMAVAFTKAYPRIQKTLRDHEPPFVASVDATGQVRLLTDAVRRAAKRKDGNP